MSSVRSLDDNEVGYTLLLVLLQGDATASWDYEDDVYVFNDSAPTIDDLAGQLGISIDEIKAKVQAEIRAERGAEATARDKTAAQAEGSAKGVEKKSKPAARASKAKTSPEEASASIAAALQALDAEPAGEGVPVDDKTLPLPGLDPRAAWPFPKEARP